MRLAAHSMAACAAVSLSLALPTPALAQEAPAAEPFWDLSAESMANRLVEYGSWKFEARRKGPDGKPECTETWHFDADGTGWVQSGAQRVEWTWRMTLNEDGDRSLVTRSLSDNGQPDCMGKVTPAEKFPGGENWVNLLTKNSGRHALLCNPPAYIATPDGKLTGERILRDEDCWGQIEPLQS